MANEERVEALLAVGEHDRAVSDLEAFVSQHPLRERAVGQLIGAMQSSGRQTEALRVFDLIASILPTRSDCHRPMRCSSWNARFARRLIRCSRLTVRWSGATSWVRCSVRDRAERSTSQATGSGPRSSDQSDSRRSCQQRPIRGAVRGRGPETRSLSSSIHTLCRCTTSGASQARVSVLRLLRGGNAQESLRTDGPWTIERTTQLVDEIGGALSAAHAAGVVHRDVKPANVLFDERGQSYLADFGIATSFDQPGFEHDQRLTPGSPSSMEYASPEMLVGEEATPQSDLYSLAAMLRAFLMGGTSDLPVELDSLLHRSTDVVAASSRVGRRVRRRVAPRK